MHELPGLFTQRLFQFGRRHTDQTDWQLTDLDGIAITNMSDDEAPFLNDGGSSNILKPLPGCIKDVSPSLTILTTNCCQLDQNIKERSLSAEPDTNVSG